MSGLARWLCTCPVPEGYACPVHGPHEEDDQGCEMVSFLETRGSAYRVRVVVTNATGRTTRNGETSAYRDVTDGVAIVVAADPRLIFEAFGKEAVIGIEYLGHGFMLEGIGAPPAQHHPKREGASEE